MKPRLARAVAIAFAIFASVILGGLIGADVGTLDAGPIQLLSATAANGDVLAKTGQLPASLGQKTMANSEPMTLASDQSNVPITLSSITASNGNVLANSGQFPTALGTANTGAQSFSVTQARGDQYTKFHVSGVGTAGILIDATARRLRRVECANADSNSYWVMVFDKSTAPVNGDTPVYQKNVGTTFGSVEFDFGLDGMVVTNGAGLAFSSARGTLTLALVNSMSCDAFWST